MTLLSVGGLLAAIVAALAVWPLLRRRWDRTGWAAVLAVTAAIGLLGPTLAIEVSETVRFARLGLTDAGVPRNVEPPVAEELVEAAQGTLREGDRWAVVTTAGRCAEDELTYQWLAFRLHPAPADCADPDVTVYVGVTAPDGAAVQARTPTGTVVR
jgi:hypothetical protein